MRTYMLKLLLLVLGCLPPGQLIEAAFLQECEGYIITLITNPNSECSEFIHCDGDNSYYCNGECDEPVSCYETTPVDTTTQQLLSTVTREASTNNVYTEPYTTTTKISTTTTKRTTTTVTTTTKTSSNNPYVICRESGQNMVFPYPPNNSYYYQCISKYLLLQQCPQNFFFNESEGKCTGRSPYRL
ncbi:uncharacterized protein LOC132789251 [Drosophila nasuta]|uniref:uncharacterized protein LOC132789251 n=1 Tax=Drosophila nasuta TaxID=42062 RepID=UPI00295E3A7F|nr:uncharacterized protein LOC132789251 [Drosophila nasuta]